MFQHYDRNFDDVEYDFANYLALRTRFKSRFRSPPFPTTTTATKIIKSQHNG